MPSSCSLLLSPPLPLLIPHKDAKPDLVRVDVVVTDADNRPVTGLRVEDFELLDEGRPHRIVEFRPVSIPVTRRDADVKVPKGRAPSSW